VGIEDGERRALHPATGAWTELTPLPEPRAYLAAVPVNGKILVLGGVGLERPDGTRVGAESTVYEYDPATNEWTTRPGLASPRSHAGAAVVGGKVYLFGGDVRLSDGSIGTTDTILEYDARTYASRTLSRRLGAPRRDPVAVAAGDRVYVYAGFSGGAVGYACDSVEEYVPASDAIALRTPMPACASTAGGAEVNGQLYAVGGPHHLLEYTPP
jgi:N-acetylneuraminic acid mutarotase